MPNTTRCATKAGRYGERRRADGVSVTANPWLGMNHGFLQSVRKLDRAAPANHFALNDEASAWLKRTFAHL